MANIQSEEHFINYLTKALRESNKEVSKEELMPAEFYIKHIYNKGHANQYCLDLYRSGIDLLESDNTIKWLASYYGAGDTPSYFPLPRNQYENVTGEMWDLIETLDGVPGVYSFWGESDNCLYIGRSKNLSGRIMTSFGNVARGYHKNIYIRVLPTETASDASLLEIYFIAKHKPAFNTKDKFPDPLTVDITQDMSIKDQGRILCNEVTDEQTIN